MKPTTKTLGIAVGSASIAMLMMAGTAFADTTTVENTGNNAHITSGSQNNSTTTVVNGNTAYIDQMANTWQNTGRNSANGNIGTVGIVTGNAGVANNFHAMANDNMTSISGVGGAQSSQSDSVWNTGNGFSLQGNHSDTSSVGVTNQNNARVAQTANTNSNTGDNSANRNIGSTLISTGATGVSNQFGTMVNGNSTTISGVGSSQGDDTTQIANTGNNAQFSNQSNGNNWMGNGGWWNGSTGNTSPHNQTNVSVTNSNSANTSQMSNSNQNTGGNDTNANIGHSVVATGSTGISNMFSTDANANWTMIGVNNMMNQSMFNGMNTMMHDMMTHDTNWVMSHYNMNQGQYTSWHMNMMNQSTTGTNVTSCTTQGCTHWSM
jgi:hypothetical protein